MDFEFSIQDLYWNLDFSCLGEKYDPETETEKIFQES